MDKDEAIAFRAEHANLSAAALRDALTVHFTEKVVNEEEAAAG